ncbi:MAG: AMP-binding protein, partial [Candidatus Micrarchaeia archaeon]
MKYGGKQSVKNIPELFRERVKLSYGKLAYRYKSQDVWRNVTWGEFGKYVDSLTMFLIKNGLNKGDKISILSDTRPEWCIADMAILSSGATTVGLYPTLSSSQIEYILNHSDSKM